MVTIMILIKRSAQSIYLNRKVVFLLSFIEGFTFCVLSLFLSLELQFFYGAKRFESAVPEKTERVLYIQEQGLDISAQSAENWDTFRNEMKATFPSFGGIGYKIYKLTDCEALSEFLLWREEHGKMELGQNDGSLVKVVSVDSGLLKWIDTQNGSKNIEEDEILVGADFAPFFSIGSKLRLNGKEYRVIDYLQKNLTLPYYITIAQDCGAIGVDSCMLTVCSKELEGIHYAYNSSYIIMDDNNVAETIESVQDIAGRSSVSVSVQTIDSYIKDYKRAIFFGMQDKIVVGIMILIVCFSSVLVIHLIETLMRKREFGILYACGFSRKMVAAELSIECLLSLACACILGYMMNSIIVRFYLREIKDVVTLFGEEYWIIMGTLIGIIAGVSLLVGCLQIIHSRPSELMEDR